ncbi:low molecular weight phosphotyrosine protein phosphatase [Pedobacter sp. SD-b]|uniref:protein-tyrosine-phosphatase n=1 Tax=Pedobacter segetis TaxID=2793069 RepID=A0ABS1BFE3_9SPHI|nr:low molecular weight protein-tyrosine-phosphatase [Pedobacter segetis]MBK0381531.1 low molecular weight phosphotyrosine protein phosphatase [Pedobacter segetis]
MKILMVCLGNICRSPLAEGILQHLANEQGLDWQVDSAGTGNYHIGGKPDPRSVKVAKQHGIDISRQRARQITREDLSDFDHIYVMDKSNYKNVVALASSADEKEKIKLLITGDVVPDPYYDDALFEPVFDMIYAECGKLLTFLKK